MKFTSTVSAILLLAGSSEAQDDSPCKPKSCTFMTIVDIYASELRYYKFRECGDMFNPILGYKVGEIYILIQKDPSNYYHPVGCAYFPDGAHANKDKLEPGITQTKGNTCVQNMTCPTTIYMLNGETRATMLLLAPNP